MDSLLNKIPVPLAGLALGLAAASSLVSVYDNIYRTLLGFLAAILLIMFIIKLLRYPNTIRESFNNPAAASVTPTFTMALMILSTFLIPYFYAAAQVVWWTALLLHAFLIVLFTRKFIWKFNIQKILPSYFIVYVGIVVGSVTAPAYGLADFGRLLFWFGLVCYLLLLPLVLYRVYVIKEVPEPGLPTIIILAAPAGLCLAGYISAFPEKNMALLMFLIILSVIMALLALLYMPKMLSLKFYPSYSSFTFPFVISAVAIRAANDFLLNINMEAAFLVIAGRFLEVWALIMVFYVLGRYIAYLLPGKQPALQKIFKQGTISKP